MKEVTGNPEAPGDLPMANGLWFGERWQCYQNMKARSLRES